MKCMKEKEAEMTAEATRLTTELKKSRFSASQSQMRAETFSKQLSEMRERLLAGYLYQHYCLLFLLFISSGRTQLKMLVRIHCKTKI